MLVATANAHLQKREGDAHGQRVDACGDGEGQHGFEAQIVVELFLLPCLADHAQADHGQQAESDPVIHALDDAHEAVAQRPADHRHQRLKAAEIQAHKHRVPRLQLFQAQTLADGDREGVHAQPHGDQQQFSKTH